MVATDSVRVYCEFMVVRIRCLHLVATVMVLVVSVLTTLFFFIGQRWCVCASLT